MISNPVVVGLDSMLARIDFFCQLARSEMEQQAFESAWE